MSLAINKLHLALPIAISLALAACGGSSSGNSSSGIHFGASTDQSTIDSGTDTSDLDTTDTTTTDTSDTADAQPEVASLIVYASSRTLLSDADANPNTDGSSPVTVYMMAKDKNNIALSGVSFTPSVDNGATLLPGSVSSDGILTTWSLVPDEPRNQTVNVNITAGDISETLSIDIIGTSLQIDGPTSISMDKPTTYTVKLKDAADNGLALVPLVISSELISTTVITNSEGEAQFNIQPTIGGTYSIKAEALGTSFDKPINVSPNAFNLDSVTKEVPVGSKQSITLSWTANGSPKSGETIYLSATRGSITVNNTPTNRVTTDASGNASFEIESTTAGGTVITATDNSTFLSTSLPLEYIAPTPHYLNIQANPSLIAPLGTSTIQAQVKDENQNPVKNQIVVFNLKDTVDGTLSSSKAETDSAGKASIVYTAGAATSALNGVRITSHIEGAHTIIDNTQLTVGGEAMRIVFGHDEDIEESPPFYMKNLGVIVTDNAGNPVSGKQVDFTIKPTAYYKGRLSYDGVSYYRPVTAPCPSEDVNKNGWLDDGEDFNNNGDLEPTNATTITSSGTTDDAGKLIVKMTYPQNHAWWEEVEITAQVNVGGTKYKELLTIELPVLATDVTGDVAPPNIESPYGVGECTEAP